MAVDINTAFQAVTFVKKNIGNLSEPNKLLMANIVNSRIRDFAININPEDYMLEQTIFIQPSVDTYARPSDAQSHLASSYSGLFLPRGGNVFASIEFSTQTGAFTVGQVLTGGTSGAVGTIDQIEDNGTTGFIKLSSITGTFQDAEIITDPITGSATTVGTQLFTNSNTSLDLTNSGSQRLGFFTRGANYVVTPIPTAKTTYRDRYFPILTELITLDGATGTFIDVNAPNGKYTELLRNLLLVEYEVNDQNEGKEQNAEAKSIELMREFFKTVSKEPQVFIFEE